MTTKRKRTQDEDDAGVTFGSLTASASDAPARRGPEPDGDSLRAQLADGRVRWLKVAVPLDVHRAVHVAAASEDTTPSLLVARILRDALG